LFPGRLFKGGTKTQKRNQRRRRKLAALELTTGAVHSRGGDRGPAAKYEAGPLDRIIDGDDRLDDDWPMGDDGEEEEEEDEDVKEENMEKDEEKKEEKRKREGAKLRTGNGGVRKGGDNNVGMGEIEKEGEGAERNDKCPKVGGEKGCETRGQAGSAEGGDANSPLGSGKKGKEKQWYSPARRAVQKCRTEEAFGNDWGEKQRIYANRWVWCMRLWFLGSRNGYWLV
jgi:hypothetical protein